MTLQQAYEICIKKTDLMMTNYNGSVFEFGGHSKNGNYFEEFEKRPLMHMYNWMSSFVTGLAPLAYRTEKNKKYLDWAETFSQQYYDKVFLHPLDTMHDLGFLYMPYCAAMYELTGREIYRKSAVKAADELLKRFDVRAGMIEAWSRLDAPGETGCTIIDSMMNVPLLLWAYAQTGNYAYLNVAEVHSENVMKYIVRSDYSVCHAVKFDRKTGDLIGEYNACGYNIGSHWARGTAWAIYGFAIAARYTENERFLRTAQKIAKKYIECLAGEPVPVWDFRLPSDTPALASETDNPPWDITDIGNTKYNIDTSAAVIAIDGILEICGIAYDKNLYDFALSSISEICCRGYVSADCGVVGKMGYQNGKMSFATYGDFFLTEALQRIIFNTKTCW